MNLFCSKYKMHGMHIKTWAKLMKIYGVTDKEFFTVWYVLDFDTKEILEEAEKIEMPTDGSMYVPTKQSLYLQNYFRNKNQSVFHFLYRI